MFYELIRKITKNEKIIKEEQSNNKNCNCCNCFIEIWYITTKNNYLYIEICKECKEIYIYNYANKKNYLKRW